MIAILDPFSGIAGDMMLGALVAVGLDPDWLRALPDRLAIPGVTVRVEEVERSGIVCQKVDFDIPPQPHGRHIKEIRRLVEAADVPMAVAEHADAVFTAIAVAEGEIHGVSPDAVHLHEVGAVDAILDVVGSVWGFQLLGVERIFCGTLSLGDGFVKAAHGVLPVPAPATLKLLEGLRVKAGPEGSGELVTPTGAALVRVLAEGRTPREYLPLRSGFGAGTRDPAGRPNALRIILAELPSTASDDREELIHLATDIDDMTGEALAVLSDGLRAAGALDVVLMATMMKKGRPGTRIEVLTPPSQAPKLEDWLLRHGSTIGVRTSVVSRRALPRREQVVEALGHSVRLKIVTLPDGSERAKAEMDDLCHVAAVTGRTVSQVDRIATLEGERS